MGCLGAFHRSARYSIRKASIGSIDAARRAGTNAAASVISTISMAARKALGGSNADTPKSNDFSTRTANDAPTNLEQQ